MAARYWRSRSRSWLLFATRAPHRQTSASREREREIDRAAEKKDEEASFDGRRDVITRHGRTEQVEPGKGRSPTCRDERQWVKKKMAKNKDAWVRVSATAISLSLSLLFRATHIYTFSFFTPYLCPSTTRRKASKDRCQSICIITRSGRLQTLPLFDHPSFSWFHGGWAPPVAF